MLSSLASGELKRTPNAVVQRRRANTPIATRLETDGRQTRRCYLAMEGVRKPAQEGVEPETQGAPEVAPGMGNG